MEPMPLSLAEYAVLGLLAEGPAHGFELAKGLAPGSPIGRVLTVRRPLVYRALARLVGAGLATPTRVEPGEAGPQRVVHRITPPGRRRLQQWLDEPVGHVRELRLGFLVKLVLLERSGGRPGTLIARQRSVLGDTLRALAAAAGSGGDVVELWRAHNAAAAGSFLAELGERHPEA